MRDTCGLSYALAEIANAEHEKRAINVASAMAQAELSPNDWDENARRHKWFPHSNRT